MAELKNKPIISAVGLTKTFKDFWQRPKARAVNDIDFEIKPGEVVGLLGPNGSGKSTTVKMILGLLYPTAGSLKVFGQSPRSVEIKKQVGYLPEESYLYKYLTAEETLDFFGSLFGLSGPERKRRVDQLLDMVGLTHARRRCVGEFSKGMQRRIGLAQAMINDPSLLILDEPTSGLDPIGCREVKDLISLLKERGKTVVVTSHLLSDVEEVCDRVIILYGGKIRAEGALNDILKVEDHSQINLPKLNPVQTEKVLQVLREDIGEKDITLTNPRKDLEQFFLDVVNEAIENDVETAGATSQGEIADYLQNADDAEKNELLAALTAEAPDVIKVHDDADDDKKERSEQDLSDAITALAEKEVDVKMVKDDPEFLGKEDAFAEADKKLNDLLTNQLDAD